MTREEAKKLLELVPVVQAFIDGKTVQWSDGICDWQTTDTPEFSPCLKWRVKPPEPREFWVNLYSDRSGEAFGSENGAFSLRRSGLLECIKVREVL